MTVRATGTITNRLGQCRRDGTERLLTHHVAPPVLVRGQPNRRIETRPDDGTAEHVRVVHGRACWSPIGRGFAAPPLFPGRYSSSNVNAEGWRKMATVGATPVRTIDEGNFEVLTNRGFSACSLVLPHRLTLAATARQCVSGDDYSQGGIPRLRVPRVESWSALVDYPGAIWRRARCGTSMLSVAQIQS